MKTAWRWLALGALSSNALGFATGCEQCQVPASDGDTTETKTGFCSVKKFPEEPSEAQEAVDPSGTVRIESINGKVTVTDGESSEVYAQYHPFVYRAFNTPESERQDNFKQLKTSIDGTDKNDDGTADELVIKTARKDGAPSTLGADMVVKLPSDFAGKLIVVQQNGAVQIDYVAGATEVQVDSDNGSVDANTGAASFVNIVNDTGDIDVESSSVSDYTVHSKGLGDVTVSLGQIEDGAMGGTIAADKGDVSLRLPSGGAFSAQATATDSVDFGSVPDACSVEEAASNSKTLTCNDGGAVFEVSADGSSAQVTAAYD